MALTNPTYLISMSDLQYFEGKLAAKYQTQAIAATGITADNVVGALEELASAIAGLPSAIVPKGTKAFSGLTPATDLAAANVGFMWNISDTFTTTADFVEGAGHSIPAGANVYVANPSAGVYKYDIFQGMYDLSGYALKNEMAINDVSGDATKKEIVLKTGLSQQVVVAHQDISGKADKVSGGTEGNLTKLDSNGNLVDAGIAATDVATIDADAVEGNIAEFDSNGNPVDSGHALSEYKTKQTPVTDPTASGYTLAFIDSISQDANGEITVTKKTVQVASTSDIDEIFA
jgi:hypothetical protein